jgi:murein L,D-transpeptidase YcbB/YkuD
VAHLDQLQPHQERWQRPADWQALLRELAGLRTDGLNPDYYLLPDIVAIGGRQSGYALPDRCHAGLASLMLAWSVTDLTFGRLDPQALGLVWHQHNRWPEASTFALSLHQHMQFADGIRRAYHNARPSLATYQNLRKAYNKRLETLVLRWPQLSPGPTLRAGDQGERVAELARRLIAQGYLSVSAPWPGGPDAETTVLFDQAMVDATMDFQRDHGLTPDGLAGRNTRAALNLPPAAWTARIRANLERMRWFAPYLQPDQLLVDIAGARVQLLHAGQVAWEGRAQVGRAERKTPALTSTITHVTVNPTWTIPPTIFYKDTLPAIQQDPDYLYRNRLTVLDHDGTALDPDQIDWSQPGNLLLRQAAGPGNALGEVVIRFPNPFSVYLHDTPSQRLFGTPERFYSSGCVRVENAVSLTDQLFDGGSEDLLWRLKQARHSGNTRNVSLPRGIPLIMAYWTAEADKDGRVIFRRDTYGEDEQIVDLLEAEGQVVH